MTQTILVLSQDSDAPAERIEAALPLNAARRLDAAVWAGGAWPASRHVAGQAPLHGALHFDPDGGWSFHFAPTSDDPDAPQSVLLPGEAPLTLGCYVSLRDPDGRERAWQVVSLV